MPNFCLNATTPICVLEYSVFTRKERDDMKKILQTSVILASCCAGLMASAEQVSAFYGRNLAPGESIPLRQVLNLGGQRFCDLRIQNLTIEAAAASGGVSILSLMTNGYESERRGLGWDPYMRQQRLSFFPAGRLCSQIQTLQLRNSGNSLVYVGSIFADIEDRWAPPPPPPYNPYPPSPPPYNPPPYNPYPPSPPPYNPPPHNPPLGRCEMRDMGSLTVKGRSSGSKLLQCNGGEVRRSQTYSGTSAPCDWDLGDTWARLTCHNSGSGSIDADHVYIECCQVY